MSFYSPSGKQTSSSACPRCGAQWSPGKVMCPACGFQHQVMSRSPAFLPRSFKALQEDSAGPQAAPMAPAQGFPLPMREPSTSALPPVSRSFGKSPHSGLSYKIGISMLIIACLIMVGGLFGGFLSTPEGKAENNLPATITALSTPQTTPLFADEFANNDKNWHLQSEAGKFAVTLGNGKLSLENDDHRILWAMVPHADPLTDFQLFTDASLAKGDQNNGYGVFIRGDVDKDGNLSTYYRFALYGDSTYAIFKGAVDGQGKLSSTRLLDYTKDTVIQGAGKTNQLVIKARGNVLTMIVNGKTLASVQDANYDKGGVALYVVNLEESQTNALAEFTHFGLYPLN